MSNIKPEKLYAIIALIAGILFVFTTPPFQSPDEDSHFKKAYQLSKGKIYPEVVEEKQVNYFPTDMINYIDETHNYMSNLSKKYTYEEFLMDQYIKTDYNNLDTDEYSTATTLPLVYSAEALSMTIGKAFARVIGMSNVSTVYQLYFARIGSLLLTVFLIYQAIKIIPIFKKTMTVVALMPMTIFLSSMVSYDSILISLSLLIIAVMLDLIYGKKYQEFNWKHILLFGIIGFILFNVKTVYSSVFVLALFIPTKRFGSLKKQIISYAIISGLVLGLTALYKIPLLIQDIPVTINQELASEQLSWVLDNFLDYISILFRSIYDQRLFHLNGMIGTFGSLDTYLPFPILLIYLLLLPTIALIEGGYEKIKISNKIKLTLVITIVITVLAIFSAMYIQWTSVLGTHGIGASEVSGVQGRYYIPLLFPLLLIFSNKFIKKRKICDNILNNYYIVIILCLVVSIFTVLTRFWI